MKPILITFLLLFAFVTQISAEESKTMNHQKLAAAIKEFLKKSYPDISVEVKPWDEDYSRLALYFTEKRFSVLYPMQRYHYLIHLIPEEFLKAHLEDSVWFELAPGEKPEDLKYPDEELIKNITPDVLNVLNKVGFFEALDHLMAPENKDSKGEDCYGDFRNVKKVLKEKGFGVRNGVDEVFDICHVLMAEGGYCDCEVLINVAETSRLKERLWIQREKQKKDQEGN
jgi:hypothetical protein